MKQYIIYTLIDINNPISIRWVGVTSQKLSKRLTQHRNSVRISELEKTEWVRNNKVEIVQIDESNNLKDAYEKEKYWIGFYREKGHSLFNKATGGYSNSGFIFSQESRKRISQSSSMKNNPETRKKTSASLKELWNTSPTLKKNLSDKMKKIWQDEDYRKNASERFSKAQLAIPKNVREKMTKAIIEAQSKVVLQYDLLGNFISEFSSTKQAEIIVFGKPTSIVAWAARKNKAGKGFIWKYKTNI